MAGTGGVVGGGGVPSGGGGGSGAGGGGSTVTPSAGCGKAGRPAGGVVTVAGEYIATFPDTYDGSNPMPMIFGFHGAGRTNDQFRTVDAHTQGTDLEKSYVMVYGKSSGDGWVLATDSPRLTSWYSTMLSSYCVDTAHVFATGHSSGAQLIVQLMCAGETRFHAIAPVASSAYCTQWTPAVPAMSIHGRNDTERASTSQDADGRKDLAPYVASAMCASTTTPYTSVAGCTSIAGGAQVDPGCVSYDGCSVPFIWCNNNDPNYSGTNHGWPCFANKAIFDFFRGLP